MICGRLFSQPFRLMSNKFWRVQGCCSTQRFISSTGQHLDKGRVQKAAILSKRQDWSSPSCGNRCNQSFNRRQKVVCNAFSYPSILSKKDKPLAISAMRSYTTLPPSKQFNFIADAASKAAPAVVYVEVEIGQGGYFGMQGAGAGSGFIVTDYGIVITNAHVVHQASRVRAKTVGGEVFGVNIIDIDPVADLAILQLITNQKLPTVPMGNSSTLRPGEWVVALGSPLNLSNTVTAGIVSAVHRGGRDIGLRKGDMQYIQTDAAINRGNSGGPLINLDGEVIGINTMTLVNTTGISFAIPVDRAKAFLLQALESQDRRALQKGPTDSRTPKSYMGVKMMTLGPEIEAQLRNQIVDFPDVSHGVLVVDVVEGSPAARAGIQPYDVITEVDSVNLNSSGQLHDIVTRGRSFSVTVLRKKNEKKFLQINPRMVTQQ